ISPTTQMGTWEVRGSEGMYVINIPSAFLHLQTRERFRHCAVSIAGALEGFSSWEKLPMLSVMFTQSSFFKSRV
uniref:Uncharacterized protein n=1 Tax=Scophthalmus maximus TaxID=52904 RepID=A0A8D3B1G5_SCOMX